MSPLPGGEGYEARHVSVHRMMATVYRVAPGQIVGMPSWADSEPYDVEAKAEQRGSREQLEGMFRRLLADRFKLQFHSETRQLPLYELTVDRGGSKLKINDTADEFSGRIGPNLMKPGNPGLPGMTGAGVKMLAFCWSLAQILQRPVVDKTGLKAYYDFKLEYASALPGSPTPAPDGIDRPPQLEGPSIFSALREQLGLRLDARKGPVEIIVIDHIEKPASN